jgi:nucleotide-binding universal stress UspA family protein
MFDNVLVGARDREGGRDALALARQLVSPVGRLTLAHVQVVARKPSADSGAVREAAERERVMKALASLSDEANTSTELASVKALSPARGLHTLVGLHAADLLVVGASRRSDLDRMFSGDDTREVLEGADCPVAIAPLGYGKRSHVFKHVAVAYDGSPASDEALDVARAIAVERRAKLSAFQAVSEPIELQDEWKFGAEIDRRVATARERIAELGGVEAHAGYGEVVEELAAFEASVDMLVIGSHRYTLADRLRDGSIAQALADRPSSPLLVLPSRESRGLRDDESPRRSPGSIATRFNRRTR